MSNWLVVIQCAVENCLYRRSFVDYAVRDYVLTNLNQLQLNEITQIKELISAGISQVQPHKHAFWQAFQEALNEKSN